MDPYQGGPGPKPADSQPIEPNGKRAYRDGAFTLLVMGWIALGLAMLFILSAGYVAIVSGLSSLLTLLILTLPVVAINLVSLWRFARKMKTPLGQAMSNLAVLGSGMSMVALSLIAAVIAFSYCTYMWTDFYNS